MKPKPKKVEINDNKEVYVYTRISQEGQSEHSLEMQNDGISEYAKKRGFTIIKQFGYKNESAKADVTRKEFQKMLGEIAGAKKKPYAVLIRTIDRFSRTGANAISIIVEKLKKNGVYLIETSTGISTETEQGELEICKGLIKAREFNIEKVKIVVPSMIKSMKNGMWLGRTPRGYDSYGRKVKNISNIRGVQEKLINDEGRLLRKAWKLKIQGNSDAYIIKKLNNWGMVVSKQFISDMWQKPFYCGINTNRGLDEPVKGNWEPLISEEDFWKVQEIISPNKKGYKIEKSNENRPLIGSLICSICGGKLTGYEIKKKHLHYYNCQKCKGVIINANQTVKAKGKGANELFAELLSGFIVPDKYFPLIMEQLKKIFANKYSDSEGERMALTSTLNKLYGQLEGMEERYALGSLRPDLFDKYSKKITEEISQIQSDIENCSIRISNLNEKIKMAVNFARDVSNIWVKENLDVKRKLQNLVFPNGIIIDTSKRQYLTKDYNSFFQLINCLSVDSAGNKTRLPINNNQKSCSVPGTGLEPAHPCEY